MIKPLYIVTMTAITLFGSKGLYAQGTSPMHKMQQVHPESLPKEQRVVMHRLSPKYQHIYLYVLNEEEREDVVRYYRRGDNPDRVINCMLQKDRKENRSRSRSHHVSHQRQARVSYAHKEAHTSHSHKEANVYEEDNDVESNDYSDEGRVTRRNKKKYYRNNGAYSQNKRARGCKKHCSKEHSKSSFLQKCRSFYPCSKNTRQMKTEPLEPKFKKSSRGCKKKCSCRSRR